MWNNDVRKKRIVNAVLAVLIIASICVLGYFMVKVRAKNSADDAILATKSTEQQQQQVEAKQEELEDVQKAYEQDVATVAQYMPGIVCWGDQLTAGSFGNVSYPDILQKYINAYICDIYDFASTIENAEEFTRMDWSPYKIDIPVVNMGSGSETSGTVVGRSGAGSLKLTYGITIPSTTEKVQVTLKDIEGMTVTTLLSGGDNGVNDVTIQGISGKLSLSNGYYYFERNEEGEETDVPKGTEVITSAADMYRDYIHVIWIGTYGGYSTADDLVNQVKTLLSRQTGNSDRFIVIGPCSKGTDWESNISYLNNIDDKMLQAFGNNYINLRKYLCSDGMTDAKLSPTNIDKADINIGAVPYTFRSVSGTPEFSAVAYKLIGKLVYERMEKLGFFEEIMDELNIAETTKNLLKDNPNYFANVIS